MTLNMPRFSLEQFFMAAFSTAESTERTGSTERCFSRSDRKTVVRLASENPWKKTNKREKNQWFQGVEMLHHWLQRDNKWAEILGLFEAYLWILRQIFPPLRLFLWTANVTFTEGMEGEGAGDVREAESLRFWGFCRPWAAALSRAGVYSYSCAQVGMQWGHLGPAGVGAEPAGLDPKLILGKYKWLVLLWFHRGQGWVSSPSSSWDGIFGKAGMSQTQISGLRDPSCFGRGFSMAVKFTLV